MTGGTTAAANNAINMTVVISYRSANELGIIIAPDAAEVAATARGANFFLPEKETWPTSKRKPVAITNTSSFNYYVTVPPDGVTLSFVVRNRN